ncbi:charged multivesicular body protein 4b-like [Melanotaenia boesemani]|uniref:charged multivesicular body protein 4b-like n=1 Tax=Melanotaenia boesemani TaxID=1250792 RepID=UPI001C045400|nr:charged multivesicular body protein 4b-like [Melanotaenia boesemani]
MSLFVNFLSGGQRVKNTACHPTEIDEFTEIEETLTKKTEFLKKKIDLELLNVKKNIKNRRVALQALRRKKWYEKHLKLINCAVKAMKSAHEHIETFNKVNDLIKDIPKEEAAAQDMSINLLSSINQEVEFDEDDLLAELERLEKSLDENFSDADTADGVVRCSTSPPQPSEIEEDEIEDALEYLRRWANDQIQLGGV